LQKDLKTLTFYICKDKTSDIFKIYFWSHLSEKIIKTFQIFLQNEESRKIPSKLSFRFVIAIKNVVRARGGTRATPSLIYLEYGDIHLDLGGFHFNAVRFKWFILCNFTNKPKTAFNKMIELLRDNFSAFFEESLLQEINETGVYKDIPEGEILMDIGTYVTAMPLLISGVIKVMREDDDGDELLLYFLERGDTCAMSLSCCLGQKKSEIRAVAETDTRLIMIPIQKMEEWTSKYKSWRNFVFNSYHQRLNEMLETIDSIAFLNMDERLWKYLQEKVRINKSETILNTHQEIAYDLHTSRVVISRLLKTLENKGKISLQRNAIKVINASRQ